MAYKGQPYPTTVVQKGKAKVSDGKSVRAIVPENTEIEAQALTEVGGWLGFPSLEVKTGAGETAEVVVTIAQEEFETDLIDETQDFKAGTKVYWDSTAGILTETETGNRPAGRVTVGKDANNVIWFILGPQV